MIVIHFSTIYGEEYHTDIPHNHLQISTTKLMICTKQKVYNHEFVHSLELLLWLICGHGGTIEAGACSPRPVARGAIPSQYSAIFCSSGCSSWRSVLTVPHPKSCNYFVRLGINTQICDEIISFVYLPQLLTTHPPSRKNGWSEGN